MFDRVLNTSLYFETKGIGKGYGPKLFCYIGPDSEVVKIISRLS